MTPRPPRLDPPQPPPPVSNHGRTIRKSRRQLRDEAKYLRDENARLVAALGRTEAKLAVARCDADMIYTDLACARDELRRVRGELTTVADRAMPGGDAA